MSAIERRPGEREQRLKVEVSLSGERVPAGDVVLLNHGPEPLRVWDMGNSWGDVTVSFEISGGGDAAMVTRKPQVYTRNVPSSLEIPPGGRHAFPFDLRDGTWETGSALQRAAEDALLVAVYEVVPDRETEEHGVWTGRIRSDPVPLNDPA